MEQLIIVVAVLPLISALLVQLLVGRIGRRIARVSVAATTLSFLFCALLLLWQALAGHGPNALPLGNGAAIMLFDPLSVLLACIILAISLIVHLYSVRYVVSLYVENQIILLSISGEVFVCVINDMISPQ